MNLLQKLGVTHDIKDYLLIIENSNTSSACVRFVRYVGLNEFLDLFSNSIILNDEIDYYKHLTDYVKEEKRYITDFKAKALAKPFYVQFSNDYFNYLKTQEEAKPEKKLQPLSFMC